MMENMSAAAVRPLALIAAAALMVTACSSGGQAKGHGASVSTTAQVHSSLHWTPCPAEGTGVECAMLSVPLNYADPSGRHIQLALDMVPATVPASKQQGILLVNPGGPGGDGLPLAAQVAAGLAPSVAAQYDVVGFDPRGVGSSVPELTCDPSFFKGVRPDYVPANAAAIAVLENRARTYAADCEQKFGWLLPYMTTQDVARDLDSIRTAFGVAKVNYYAFSYGTYIGQVYATMFPDRVRRMVLDSTVDPTGVWYQDNDQQDYAFQGRQEAFFAWMAKYNSVFHLGSTQAQVQASWYKARTRLAEHPINGSDGKPLIGADEFDDTFLLGGYLDTLWPGLAQALSAYLNHNQTADLLSQYEQNGAQSENEFAVYNAVQCSDVNWPKNFSYWIQDTENVYKTAPFQAWDNAWFNAACAFWPVKGPATPLTIDGKGVPGILMLQGTLDPATPYQGAQNAHKALPSARMVVVEGGGNHGQSMEQPPDTCVQNYVNAYLATGALPDKPGPVNATCAPVPDPSPAG
jgi:pimeloyl-ACP methyl ester carboxylesterase